MVGGVPIPDAVPVNTTSATPMITSATAAAGAEWLKKAREMQ